MDKPKERQIGAWLEWLVLDWNDQCLTGTIGACGSTGMGFNAGGGDDAWGDLRVEHW